MTETSNPVDVDSFALIVSLAVVAMAIGNFQTILIQNSDRANTNYIYWALNIKNFTCLLIWAPYLFMPSTNTLGVSIVGFYVSFAGSTKLIPDLNNRYVQNTYTHIMYT